MIHDVFDELRFARPATTDDKADSMFFDLLLYVELLDLDAHSNFLFSLGTLDFKFETGRPIQTHTFTHLKRRMRCIQRSHCTRAYMSKRGRYFFWNHACAYISYLATRSESITSDASSFLSEGS